jgi:hypothetical protein
LCWYCYCIIILCWYCLLYHYFMLGLLLFVVSLFCVGIVVVCCIIIVSLSVLNIQDSLLLIKKHSWNLAV